MKYPSGIAALLLALGLLIGCAGAPKHTSEGQSILYVAERGSAKVYIFGTCGGKDRAWLGPHIEKALAESKEFWREIPTGPFAAEEYVQKLARRERGTLFDDLSSEETKRVLDAAAGVGITRAELEPVDAWYAARTLSFAYYAKAGQPVGQGENPELVMSELAQQQGKPVKAEYASWEEFLDFFDRMPPVVQKQYLLYTLDFLERRSAPLEAPAACAKGDVSYYQKGVDEMRTRYPELYTVLNGERDEEWAHRIDQFLTTGGTYFILVGVNHTLGPASIQEELKRLAIGVHRM